jgi:hypothetical protein
MGRRKRHVLPLRSGCPYCGGTDGCYPSNWPVRQIKELNAEDWREIYHFMRYVYMPFVHRIIARAILRGREEEESGNDV